MLKILREPLQLIAALKWNESQHPRGADGRFAYAPQQDAPVEGEWDRTGIDPNAMIGPAPVWRQQHQQLVADALRSWVGDPSSFRIHAQDALAGAEIPPSGSGKQMRAQAEALLWELEHKAIPVPVPLYRGSGTRGDKSGAPFSWSESPQIAKVFATRYGGHVEMLPAGTARGLKVRDYTRDAFGEKQWVVRAGNNPVLKWDPQQQRDAKGRWTETGSVRVGDRDITVVLPKRAAVAGDQLVLVDVASFDAEFQRDTDLYLSQGGGKNAIGERYARFGKFLAENTSIEASEVTVQDNGKVGFTNGRHRWAWLRDQGVTVIPVAMTPASVINAKKYGFLATRKWDEAKHPRDAEGQWTASGGTGKDPLTPEERIFISQWTNAEYLTDEQRTTMKALIEETKLGGRLEAYRPEARTKLFRAQDDEELNPGIVSFSTSQEYAQGMFGDKVFMLRVDDRLPALDLKKLLIKGANLEEEVVVSLSRMAAHRAIRVDDSDDDEDDDAYKWDPQQPRDAKGRFVDLGLHGDQVTLLHGTTRQNAEAILAGGFKPGNPEAVAAQMEQEYKLPAGSIAGHVAFQFAKGRKDLDKVHFTTDERVADQYSVPEVMQDALLSAHMLLHPTPEDEPFTKEKHALRAAWIAHEATRLTKPALLAVTVPFATVGRHGFGKQFTLSEFKDLLTKFPKAEEDIFNNITIPIEALHGAKITRRKWDVQKQDHKFGNTQIAIPPTSAAAASLNAARAQILDDDTMATGKDVDPNHVTVRFGLENDDLDDLRLYIARQLPFEAYVSGIELFPASEHSDGAVPVVARIASPELREIEAAIGRHADFKEKSFPVYKPHCTLAYCKPGSASKYLDLPVQGSFLVQDITISHASGVKETIAFGGARKFDEAKHPRQPAGSIRGGEFMATLHGPSDALQSLLNKEKDVSIDRNDVRAFLELAAEQDEDPDMTKLHVEGTEMFGGNGLGIKREDMPQIPRVHREQFLDELEHAGITITAERVDPLALKPTQSEISARNVALKLQEYEAGKKKFPPLLISQNNRILDGHHHWGMMAAFALEFPDAKVPVFRLQMQTKEALAAMHSYDKKYGIVRKVLGQKADPATGRYVTPFVSFEKQGDAQLQLIASLNSSRLATWGFTAEAEVLGMARYRLSAVLDGRTSDFCRAIDGKIFNVPDARKKVIEVLNVQNPEDLRTVQPWPKQTKAAIAEFEEMSAEELTALGFHIPPYHPYCRTICRIVSSSEGELEAEDEVPTIPEEVEAFQPITAADLKELGIEATQEDVDQWNAHVGMTPVELLTRLSGLPPREVMTKPLGVGANPITFTEQGIGFNVRGSSPSGVEFKLGAILEPFTGTYYLTQADLIAGSPKLEAQYLKRMFSALIEMGLKSSATEVAVGVGGNAAYYAKLGFLPDELEWDTLRSFALNEVSLQPVLASLNPEDRLLVQHLLQDKSVQALNTLVKLPFTYQGKTIGEWLFGEATGTWALDLTDEALVTQAQAYLL